MPEGDSERCQICKAKTRSDMLEDDGFVKHRYRRSLVEYSNISDTTAGDVLKLEYLSQNINQSHLKLAATEIKPWILFCDAPLRFEIAPFLFEKDA